MPLLMASYSSFIGILLFSEAIASACSCVELSQRQARDSAFAVFEGEVTNIHYFEPIEHRDVASRTLVTFAVSRYWKGQVQRTIQVHAMERAIMCDSYQFEIGKKYIVYAVQQDKDDGWADQYPGETKILGVGGCILRIKTNLGAERNLLGSGVAPKRKLDQLEK